MEVDTEDKSARSFLDRLWIFEVEIFQILNTKVLWHCNAGPPIYLFIH